MKKFVTVLFAILQLFPVLSVAGPYEDGKTAWRHLNYEEARYLLQPLADRGDAPAQYMIGVMYYNGEGAKRDYKEALKWFRLAAEQGNRKAQIKLSVMYEGYGGNRDYQEAYFWRLLAAAPSYDPLRLYNAKLIARHLTHKQISAVEKRVKIWKLIAASPPGSSVE